MKNKTVFIIACGLILVSSINCASINQRLYDYFRSKWTELSNSQYTRLIPKKTLSYILPAMTIIPGALVGKMIAENKLIQTIPDDLIWAPLISRRNYDIVRSWGVIGGLAALATYKIISYYQQPLHPENNDETSSEK